MIAYLTRILGSVGARITDWRDNSDELLNRTLLIPTSNTIAITTLAQATSSGAKAELTRGVLGINHPTSFRVLAPPGAQMLRCLLPVNAGSSRVSGGRYA